MTFFSTLFMNLPASQFYANMLMFVMSSWLIDCSFDQIEVNYLTLLINFSLRYILPDIKIATHAYFFIQFLWNISLIITF